MTRETQNTIMVWSAVFMIVVGVALNIAGFIVPPTGEISDSVLCPPVLPVMATVFPVSAVAVSVCLQSVRFMLNHSCHIAVYAYYTLLFCFRQGVGRILASISAGAGVCRVQTDAKARTAPIGGGHRR